MAAQSSTSIANRALQMLGAASILALTDNSKEARESNRCYDDCRRAELRAHPWNFSFKRALLAPSATPPAFGFGYAFPLPADCLRVPLPNDFDLDWEIEGRAILTNSTNSPWSASVPSGTGASLALRYVADIEDATLFDATFCEALAARMAGEMCEVLTQSNQKAQIVQGRYKDALAVAHACDALENLPAEPPVDPWVAAHRS